MNRKVLLVEPNYKNKYPPMGLMKLATYYRQSGDDVRFFKGDLRDLAADLVIEDLLEQLSSIDPDTKWKKYKLVLINYIRKANTSALDECEAFTSNAMAYQLAKDARLSYKRKHSLKKHLEQMSNASGLSSGCQKHLSFTDLCLRTIWQKNGRKNSGAYLLTS